MERGRLEYFFIGKVVGLVYQKKWAITRKILSQKKKLTRKGTKKEKLLFGFWEEELYCYSQDFPKGGGKFMGRKEKSKRTFVGGARSLAYQGDFLCDTY